MFPTLQSRKQGWNSVDGRGYELHLSRYLSPVMVMVKPSYSFPGSFMLGTLEFTVNPSLVLLLNCFRKQTHEPRRQQRPLLAFTAVRTRASTRICIRRQPVAFTFIIGSRSSTLFTFSKACRTSRSPLGLYALRWREGRRHSRAKTSEIGTQIHLWSKLPMIHQYPVFDEVQDAVKVG